MPEQPRINVNILLPKTTKVSFGELANGTFFITEDVKAHAASAAWPQRKVYVKVHNRDCEESNCISIGSHGVIMEQAKICSMFKRNLVYPVVIEAMSMDISLVT